MTTPNSTIRNMVRNRGNQRLWIIVSVFLVVVVGWLSWKPLPQYYSVDVSQLVSAQCQAEENATLDAEGEKAYRTCMEKRGDVAPGSAIYLLNESACTTERLAAGSMSKANADLAELDCETSRSGKIAAQFQPAADHAVDDARIRRIAIWAVITLSPPILLPLFIAGLLYAVWIVITAAKWIENGYRHPE